jgi:SAM-dependent methyltransferase
MLILSEKEIRRHGPGHALAVCWRQWRAERALARRGVHFRATEPAEVAAAYAAMSDEDFAGINARQDWANWRTIPRGLSGHVPDRALRVLDLGCGSGSSTTVLAFYCPAGSRITGYEMVLPLLEMARRRNYVHRSGKPVQVSFVCQGVTQPFREADGNLVPENSVDLVNASGVVGHHLHAESVKPLVEELCRVLVPDGIAMLDVGPSLLARDLLPLMTAAGLEALKHVRSWFLDPTGEIVFQKHQNPSLSA